MEYLEKGTKLKSRYEVHKVIGRGGFGVTYLANDSQLDEKVVIKEYLGSPKGKKDFIREARRMSELFSVDTIVKVLDYFEEDQRSYLVMEYIRGVNLSDYLERLDVPMSWQEAWEMLKPVMSAMEKVHKKGLIHRDLNPSNLIITENGNLKIIDFGASRSFEDYEKTMTILVKKGYTPPEQYQKEKYQGPWTDVYAICATLYEMITGVKPDSCVDRMKKDTLYLPSSYGAEITPEEEQVLIRGLELDYKKRIQNMGELLATEQSDAGRKQERDQQEEQIQKHKMRKRMAIIGSVLLLVIVCAAGAIGIFSFKQPQKEPDVTYAGSYEYGSGEYMDYQNFIEEHTISEKVVSEISSDMSHLILHYVDDESICYELDKEAVVNRGEPCNALRFFVKSDVVIEELAQTVTFTKEKEETDCFAFLLPYQDVVTHYLKKEFYVTEDEVQILVYSDLINGDLLQITMWTLKNPSETESMDIVRDAVERIVDTENNCMINEGTLVKNGEEYSAYYIYPYMRGHHLYYNP